jgi:four helix bundle protein
MTKEELKQRTKSYSIANARLVLTLPNNLVNRNYSDQLNKSASSTGANYREACRAKSKADFINKLKIVEEELDETLFFLELIVELNPEFKEKVSIIYKE